MTLLASGIVTTADGQETSRPNDPGQQQKPYLLVIGVDGLRFDFVQRYGAKNIQTLAKRGSSVTSLVPAFPSTTFPNFYTLATGLVPERHGIVGMNFYDPQRGAEFHYRTSAADGSWFGGTPIWVLAERQGMRTASYFWVGTEAEIQGTRPTFYYRYDPLAPRVQRVKQAIDWLHLPEERRPHLILLYFSEVDSAGHVFGADSEEVKLAVREVDESIGELLAGIASVRPQVNVVVVSDHGMANIERFVDITGDADFSGVRVVNEFSHVMVYSDDANRVNSLKTALDAKGGPYRVFRRAETPAHLRFARNPRIGDLVILPTGRFYMYVRTPELAEEARHPEHRKGWHGWDPGLVPEMGAFFCAAGPQIRSGQRLHQVQNTDVFLLLAGILGLTAPETLDSGDALAKALHAGAPR